MTELLGPKPPDWFVGDGCTMSPDGWWREACRWHDWCYATEMVSRWTADWYFYRNLLRLHVPPKQCLVYWLAVRTCGWRAWRKGK